MAQIDLYCVTCIKTSINQSSSGEVKRDTRTRVWLQLFKHVHISTSTIFVTSNLDFNLIISSHVSLVMSIFIMFENIFHTQHNSLAIHFYEYIFLAMQSYRFQGDFSLQAFQFGYDAVDSLTCLSWSEPIWIVNIRISLNLHWDAILKFSDL